MKRFLCISAFLFSLLFCQSVLAVSYDNGMAEYNPGEKPLMVVRFNQDIVSYDQTLRKVVNMALKVKPETFFDVVSIVPDIGDKEIQKSSVVRTEKIARLIERSGVDSDRIRVTFQRSAVSKNNEVHVFVR